MPLVERFLREQRMSLAVTEITGRRANQFGDFVRVLKLGTINFDTGARIAK